MKQILKAAVPLLFLCLSTVFTAQAQTGYQLSTHVLDINEGKPVEGMTVHLYRYNESVSEWEHVYQTRTDASGRVGNLLPLGNDNTGVYKFRFDTSAYFTKKGIRPVFPFIEVAFTITDKSSYHIPITISGNGYSTYRGS